MPGGGRSRAERARVLDRNSFSHEKKCVPAFKGRFGPYLGSGKTLTFFRNPSPMLSLVMPGT
jgi:topoisomerase IA-like protein